MHLLSRCLIRGTHHARIFSADTLPVALFNGNVQPTIMHKGKMGFPRTRTVLSAISQVYIHPWRADDLAGVENIVRIGSALQETHSVRQLASIGLFEELGASQSIAVLTAHGAAKFQG
jgi:hypothetical protein